MIELELLKQRLFGGNSQIRNIKFFPGSSSDSSPEDMAREINKFFADPEEADAKNDLVD